MKVFVKISYLEIYNETIIDLLNTSRDNLDVRETKSKMIVIPGLKELDVKDYDSAIKLYEQGENNKKVGPTASNVNSSRSHTIFRLQLTVHPNELDKDVRITTLNLIDLAGSESINKSKTEGLRQKEGTNINKSLLALSNVINKLSKNESKQFINFRDSKLTRILGPHLTGNSKTFVICTVNPTGNNYLETVNTLSFAQKVGAIVNIVKQNPKVSNEKSNYECNEMQETICQQANTIEELQLELQDKERDLQFQSKEINTLQVELQAIEQLKNSQIEYNQNQQQEVDLHRSNTKKMSNDYNTLYDKFKEQRLRGDQLQEMLDHDKENYEQVLQNLQEKYKELEKNNYEMQQILGEKQIQSQIRQKQKQQQQQELEEQQKQQQQQQQDLSNDKKEQSEQKSKQDEKSENKIINDYQLPPKPIQHKKEYEMTNEQIDQQHIMLQQRDRYSQKLQIKAKECFEQNNSIQQLRHENMNLKNKVEGLKEKLEEFRWHIQTADEEKREKNEDEDEQNQQPDFVKNKHFVKIMPNGEKKTFVVRKKINNSLTKEELKKDNKNNKNRIKFFQQQLSKHKQEICQLYDDNKVKVDMIHRLEQEVFLDSNKKQIIDIFQLDLH